MASGRVRVICGAGNGKSASALGYAMMGVFHGKRVIMVQFLKGMIGEEAADVLKRLEPDLKFFCFEHSKERFEDLPEEQKHEELMNLRNGFNFAKKVMTTGECDVLILDEILGIVDQGIISAEEFQSFLEARDEETDLVMTGRVCPEGIEKYVDEISVVSTGKNSRISQAENIDIDNHQE